DTVFELAGAAATRGWRLFLLGAAEGIAERASQALRERHPSLQVVGTLAGSPSSDDEELISRAIRAARPHVLLVAFGAPIQDLWIAQNLDRLGVPVAMGVGGSFDFIAGLAPRAPGWMQRLGVEWLYRLIKEPWRWRRMLALPRFASRVLLQAVRRD
ncbi:MAG: WecB/TagA/CpsF family glycosyltransferase, partial [Anaerolineae bacterium]